MKYIQELIEKILNFSLDLIIEIEDKQEEGDVVLGEVPIELRKLYSYRQLQIDEHNIVVREFGKKRWKDREEKNEEAKKIVPILGPLKGEIDLLEKMFWASLRRELNYPDGSLGIRSGWKVVVPKKEEDEMVHGGIIVVGSSFPFHFPFPPR